MKSPPRLPIRLVHEAAATAVAALAVALGIEVVTPRALALQSKRAAPVTAPAGHAASPASSSTAALFTYRRDDATAGSVTLIRVDAHRTARAAINQDIFGNFIEHLGGVVYQGLWAQLLINPSLEAVDSAQSRESAPPAWRIKAPAMWRPGGNDMQGFHSPGYATLLPASGAGERSAGSLVQTIWPPAHRVLDYTGSLAVRVLPEADVSAEKQPVAATLRVTIAPDRTGAQPIASTLIHATGTEWTLLPIRLVLPAGSLARGEAALLAVEHVSGAAADIDRVELSPSDAIADIDPDVLRKAREWHMPLLRWPGGNFASGYHWRDGIGPRNERPTRRNAAWGDVEPNEFGTNEFLSLCCATGVKPQLTVNAGDGTPEEAAAWVRYCNAPATDTYGRLRNDSGHPTPYNVRLWEVGNELYGGWQIGHTVPKENATRFVRFRDAMLRADPGLRLIATGKSDEFLPDGMARNAAWNEALLRASVAGGARPPDYLSIHPLVPLPDSLRRFSYAEQYQSAMAHPAFLDRVLLPDLEQRIAAITGPKSRTRIAVTEWGLIVGGAGWQAGPNHDTLAGAVYNGLCLNAMLRHSDAVTLANMTAFMHGGGIKKPGGVTIVDPQYYTQQLYAAAGLRTPVATEVVGPGTDVPQRGYLPAIRAVPDVDVFAALTGSGGKLIVCAVNRRESGVRAITLQADGFPARRAAATVLAGATPMARNTLKAPDAVRPQRLALVGKSNGGMWRLVLPPHSVAVITLTR